MTPEERVAQKIKKILEEENCVLTVREKVTDTIFKSFIMEVRVVYSVDKTRQGALLHSE